MLNVPSSAGVDVGKQYLDGGVFRSADEMRG